ncbi:MAG: ribosome assembly cofactor RimP [Paludibacter sp.]|jgi:ribosome maturation factor RimP|nr:ribosome assembly cofactor RimP [Paludibacter sp.]
MIDKNIVTQTVTEFLTDTDYFLTDLNVSPDNCIVVEIDSDAGGVSLDFCVSLNRYIENKLNRDTEDYELEVSSAGLTEPFKTLRQYHKNIGNDIEMLTKDGRKLRGILKDAAEEFFTLTIEKTVKPEGAKRKTIVYEDVEFRYDEVKYVKYDFKF